MDRAPGASIISGDRIVPYLATLFGAVRIGFGTAAGGVIADGRVVPEITPETFGVVRSHIHGSEGTEVTGGMLGKVRELLGSDIDSYIFSAVKLRHDRGFLSETRE
jgi:isopentenyl phosphate kinase